jgi:hypothetical protein
MGGLRMTAIPLDENALDFLDDDSRRLVKEMLKAIVEHPEIYDNGFTVPEGAQVPSLTVRNCA